MTDADPYNLQRFLDAQHGVFETAFAELHAGSKRSHWMWFVFPQLAELGRSATAKFYGLQSIHDAGAYLAHPLLGLRLRQCVAAILQWADKRSAKGILGPVDAMKLRSSLTLFDRVEPHGAFHEGLLNFFDGLRDERTLALLQRRR